MKKWIMAEYEAFDGTNTLHVIGGGETKEEAMLQFLHSRGFVGDTVAAILGCLADYSFSEPLEITAK